MMTRSRIGIVLAVNLDSHRAIAPIIANMLLVAMTATGGSAVYAISQDTLNDYQLSGMPSFESLRILGYDARDVSNLKSQNGNIMATANSGGDGDGASEQHERVTIHVQNHSPNMVKIKELRFGGTVYTFAATSTLDAHGPLSNIPGGQYDIMQKADRTVDLMLTEGQAVIQPGQSVDIIIALDNDIKLGRHTQFKITTDNDFIILGNIIVGTSSHSSTFGDFGEVEIPPESSGKCKGLTSITVLYKGPQPVTIEVKVKTGEPAFTVFSNVNWGNTITVTPPIGLEKLKSNTQFEIFNGDTLIGSIPIHTSCSQGIDVGDVYTDGTSSLEITAMGKIIVDDDEKDDKKKKKKK